MPSYETQNQPRVYTLPQEVGFLIENDIERHIFEKLIGTSYFDSMNLIATDIKNRGAMIDPLDRNELLAALATNPYPGNKIDFLQNLKGSKVWADALTKTQLIQNLSLIELTDLAEFTAGILPAQVIDNLGGIDPVVREFVEARRITVRGIAERIFNGIPAITPQDEYNFQNELAILPIQYITEDGTSKGYLETGFHSSGIGHPISVEHAEITRAKVATLCQKYNLPYST